MKDSIVNSCPLATTIPAFLQIITKIDSLLLFKLYPTFFLALVPTATYLINRKFFGITFSLVAALLIFCQFYIVYYPNMGRVAIAWGLWSIFLYFIISKKYTFALLLGIMTIFAHYGTACIMLIVLTITFLYKTYMIFRNKIEKREFYKILLMLIILISIAAIWHIGIAKESGRYINSFAINFIDSPNVNNFDINEKEPALQSALCILFKKCQYLVPHMQELIATLVCNN